MSMRLTAALGAGLLALALAQPAAAQDQQPQLPPENELSERIAGAMQEEVDPEKLSLAREVLDASDLTRPFDEILPEIADRAKTTLIRSNPQMQLGIIDVVDRVALDMVERRAELEEMMGRIWALTFSTEELQALVEFYQSPVGEKFAEEFPSLLRAQVGAAEWWSRELSQALFQRVQEELRQMAEAEGQQLQQTSPPQPPEPSQPVPGNSAQ